MTRTIWTPAMVAELRRLYPDTRTRDIAEQMGLRQSQVQYKAEKLGLRKPPETIARLAREAMQNPNHQGRRTQFAPGHKTWNTGMKGLDIGGKATRYKQGNRSGKALEIYQPIGTERVSKDGYVQRKINDDMPLQRRWRAVHTLIWEAANGPLPAGHLVVFRNGDKRDFRLENLELISRAENMRRNSYHNNYPKEIGTVIQLRGALQRKINRLTTHTNAHDHEKHARID